MKAAGFIFDLDGVIIDSEIYRDQATRDLLQKQGHNYDRDRIKPLLAGRSSREIWAIIKEYYDLPPVEELDREARAAVRELYRSVIPFVPGFESFYSALRDRFSVPSAVATGCDPEYFALIDQRLKITELYDGRIFRSDMVARGKPFPDIFEYAARQIGVEAKCCVAFEDAPLGIASALKAQCRVIALTRTFSEKILRTGVEGEMRRPLANQVLFIPDYGDASKEAVNKFICDE